MLDDLFLEHESIGVKLNESQGQVIFKDEIDGWLGDVGKALDEQPQLGPGDLFLDGEFVLQLVDDLFQGVDSVYLGEEDGVFQQQLLIEQTCFEFAIELVDADGFVAEGVVGIEYFLQVCPGLLLQHALLYYLFHIEIVVIA